MGADEQEQRGNWIKTRYHHLVRRQSLLLPVSLCLAALVGSSDVGANGRFPAANGIALHPNDPGTVLLRTTFGSLLARPSGRIDWICEQVVGYSGAQDPMVGLTADGSIIFAPFEGLTLSHDGGCSFDKVENTSGEYVIDISVDKQNPARIVAISSTGKIDGFYVQTFESVDNGNTWATIGPELGKDLLAETIDIAPSKSDRLYVSGITGTAPDRKGVLAVSDNNGVDWVRYDVDLAGDNSVYIAGVDPSNENIVYLRTDGKENDRLLVSTNGGMTFTEVATITGSMLGFAISQDGSRIALGGPSAGLYFFDRGSTELELRDPNLPVACLAWGSMGLYACGSDFVNQFTVARSIDEGATWLDVMPNLQSVDGPLESCSAETPYAMACLPQWPTIQATLGIDPNGGTSGSGGTGGSGGSNSAGSGGSGQGTGGSNNTGAAGAGPSYAGTSSSNNPANSDDGGCSVEPQSTNTGAKGFFSLIIMPLLLAGLSWRRRMK